PFRFALAQRSLGSRSLRSSSLRLLLTGARLRWQPFAALGLAPARVTLRVGMFPTLAGVRPPQLRWGRSARPSTLLRGLACRYRVRGEEKRVSIFGCASSRLGPARPRLHARVAGWRG